MRAPQLRKKINLFLLLFLIGMGLLASLWALRLNQDVRQQASGSDSVEFELRYGNTRVNPGQSVPVDVFINTKDIQVSGFTVVGFIKGLNKEQVSLVVPTVTGLTKVYEGFESKNNRLEYAITFLSPAGTEKVFSTQGQFVKIGTLILSPASETTVEMSFLMTTPISTSQTHVIEYTKGLAKVASPSIHAVTISYASETPNEDKKTCNQTCATDTECQSNLVCYKGFCRDRDDREDQKCGSVPDLGIHRSCDEYCADSRECDAKYTCYFNRCRLPENVESPNCQPAPTPSPIPQPFVPTGVGGSQPTSTPRPTASPTPAAVSARVTISSASPTPSASPFPVFTPRPATSSSATTVVVGGVQSGTADATKSSQTREIVPIPAELAEETANQSRQGSLGRTILIILSTLGIIGLIGFGIYYWRSN